MNKTCLLLAQFLVACSIFGSLSALTEDEQEDLRRQDRLRQERQEDYDRQDRLRDQRNEDYERQERLRQERQNMPQ